MSYNFNNNNFFQPWGQYPHYFAVPTQHHLLFLKHSMNSHHQLKQRNTKKMRREGKEAKKQKNESDGVKNSQKF